MKHISSSFKGIENKPTQNDCNKMLIHFRTQPANKKFLLRTTLFPRDKIKLRYLSKNVYSSSKKYGFKKILEKRGQKDRNEEKIKSEKVEKQKSVLNINNNNSKIVVPKASLNIHDASGLTCKLLHDLVGRKNSQNENQQLKECDKQAEKMIDSRKFVFTSNFEKELRNLLPRRDNDDLCTKMPNLYEKHGHLLIEMFNQNIGKNTN